MFFQKSSVCFTMLRLLCICMCVVCACMCVCVRVYCVSCRVYCMCVLGRLFCCVKSYTHTHTHIYSASNRRSPLSDWSSYLCHTRRRGWYHTFFTRSSQIVYIHWIAKMGIWRDCVVCFGQCVCGVCAVCVRCVCIHTSCPYTCLYMCVSVCMCVYMCVCVSRSQTLSSI